MKVCSKFRIRYSLAWIFALGFLACNPAGSDAGQNGAVFSPSDPADTFQPSPDAAERDAIAMEMWAALTAPACWDASFVGPATPAGTPASVSQFTFSGQYQYRYYGFDTYFGSIQLIDVGHYKGRKAALLVTWTGETEGLILVNPDRIEHVSTNPAGAAYGLTYWRSNGPCL
jgi:hypothetical protein